MEYYDARKLVINSKTLNLLNDVLHQNDVRDYIDKLLDRIEEHFDKYDHDAKNDKDSGKNDKGDIKNTVLLPTKASTFSSRYKGQWAYETRRFGENVPDEYRVSTRYEPFFAIATSVRGYDSLEDSLLSTVQGEKMEGENQLACDFLPKTADGKDQRCNGLRRDVLNKLPDMLTIHLKRFEYDVQTYQMAKVKEKFTFPMEFNMWRYTKEGCEEADQLEREKLQQETHQGGDDEGEVEDRDKDNKNDQNKQKGKKKWQKLIIKILQIKKQQKEKK